MCVVSHRFDVYVYITYDIAIAIAVMTMRFLIRVRSVLLDGRESRARSLFAAGPRRGANRWQQPDGQPVLP